jgi:formiminoglutamase
MSDIRESEKIKKFFSHHGEQADLIIVNSPSDIGVQRNLGRQGARFAPQALNFCFKNLYQHFSNDLTIKQMTASDQKQETNNFDQAQLLAVNTWQDILPGSSKLIHLGGGHDHIYPLLKSLDKQGKKIIIINFDAHCDTRVDESNHSGTPFRQFDREASRPFQLYQYGIHFFANGPSTIGPLKKGDMTLYDFEQVKAASANFSSLPEKIVASIKQQCDQDTAIIISLDADAIHASVMEAVSAVNHQGLPIEHINDWIQEIASWPQGQSVFGIYEYNPVYENLSQKGARALASLMFQFLKSNV